MVKTPDAEPTELEETHTAQCPQNAMPIFGQNLPRESNTHSHDATARVRLADGGQRNVGEMQFLERDSIALMAAQNTPYGLRKIIAVSKNGLSISRGNGERIGDVELTMSSFDA